MGWLLLLGAFTSRGQQCSEVLVEYKSAGGEHIKSGWPGNVERNPARFYMTETVSEGDNHIVPGEYSLVLNSTRTWTLSRLNYTLINCQVSGHDHFGCQCVVGITESLTASGHSEEHSPYTGYDCVQSYSPDGWTGCAARPASLSDRLKIYEGWGTLTGSNPAISETVLEIHRTVIGTTLRSRAIDSLRTLSNEYTTQEFLEDLRAKIRASLNALPNSSWSMARANAVLSMDMSQQKCATGQSIRYRFSLPSTQRDMTYRIVWDEVTHYDDGTVEVRRFKEDIQGTGLALTGSEHDAEPPDKSGTTSVENVSVTSKSGPPSLPGSGSFGQTGAADCAGCSSAPANGLSFGLSMGAATLGESAGELWLSRSEPSRGLSSPSSLRYTTRRSDVEVIPPSGAIRQIKTPGALANLVVIDSYKYEVRYYFPWQLGARGNDGAYLVGGAPFVTWTIENPDRSLTAFNRLRLTETKNGVSRVYDYEYQGNRTWRLNFPDNLRRDEMMLSLTPTTLTQTDIVRKSDGTEVLRTERVFQRYPWGSALIQEKLGDGSAIHTTARSYAQGGFANGNVLPLQQIIYPNAHWERFEYDELGRSKKKVSRFLYAPVGAAESSCAVMTYDYTPITGSGDDGSIEPRTARTIVEYLLGQEIGRTYYVIKPGEKREIRCQSPGAAWNAENNLITITTTYQSGVNAGRISSVQHPDGTMTFYSFEPPIGATKTVSTGQPNPTKTSILNGTFTTMALGEVGQMLSTEVWELVGGNPSTVLSREIYSNFDSYRRPQRVTHLDNTYEDTGYACCGVESTIDRDGTLTQYQYDALKRQTATVRNGVLTTHLLNPAGRILKTTRIGSDNSQIILRQAQYDTAGELASEINALNGSTTYTEAPDIYGGRVRTTTYPDNGTRLENFYGDGRLAKLTGTAVAPLRYEYGVELDEGVYRFYTKEIKLDAAYNDTSEWTKRYQDMLGREYKTVLAAPSAPYPFHRSTFNNQGQLVKEVDPDGCTMLYQYNGKGQLEWTALDLNQNGLIDFTGTDRITQSIQDVVPGYGTNVRRTRTVAFTTDASYSPLDIHVFSISTDGLRTWDTRLNGSVTVTERAETSFDRDNGYRYVTAIAADNSTVLSTFRYGLLRSVLRRDANTVQIGSASYEYDPHGRLWRVIDARNGATTYSYNNADQIISITTPAPGSGYTAQTTTTFYDSMLRPWKVVQPDNTALFNEYYPNGLLRKTYGSRTYPVEYTYDAQGRTKTMKTWQNFANTSGAALTTWNYHPYRGLLSEKRYADNTGPDFTYTPGARLKTRLWARSNSSAQRLLTTYTYGFDDMLSGNQHADLVGVSYSNDPVGTPAVTYTYDRRGRPAAVTRNGITSTLAYTDDDQLWSEFYSGGSLDTLSVTQTPDNLLRKSVLAVKRAGTTLAGVTYTYDNASRLSTITDGSLSATYRYLANSPLVDQITFRQGFNVRLTTTKAFDNLDRLSSITNNAALVASSHLYHYNDANQRDRATLRDGSAWEYLYDSLGQVRSAKKKWADASYVAGQQFEYLFDDIGNRTQTKSGGDSSGNGLRSFTYTTANALNQHPSRSVPNTVDILGIGNGSAFITVNGQSTARRGEYYHAALSINNAASPAYASINVNATLGGNTVSRSGNLFVPPATESFSYDLDGNLKSDGRWLYTWDAENRLIEMIAQSNVPTAAKRKLQFEYDYRSRRIKKTVWTTADGANYVNPITTKYLYDGWNLVAELDNANNLLRSYLWGLDISGTFQGAGGVGGLIRFTSHSPLASSLFPCYDGNGNITALIDAFHGQTTAQYDYAPFGELIRLTGPMSAVNPFRFSTKYTDDESDLLYYGYRFYNPSTGRWLSRDPITENGGIHLYAFVENSLPNRFDPFGLHQEAGHFYTIYAIGIARGYSSREAYKFAYFAQLPDEIGKYAAFDGVGQWLKERALENQWLHDVQQILHSLHGGDVLKRRACLRSLVADPSLSPIDRGLVLHAFGDAYAHTYFDRKTVKLSAYEYPYGHADTQFNGNSPDLPSLRPNLYADYVNDVFNSLPPGSLPQNPTIINNVINKNKELSQLSNPFAAQTTLISYLINQSGYDPTSFRPERGDYYSNPPKGDADLGPLSQSRVQRLIDLIKTRCCAK